MKILVSFLTLTLLFISRSFGQCEAFFIAIAGENGYYSFDNNSVSNNMENTSFLWQFGDGSIADGALPTHQYEQSGNYEVCLFLTVMDGNNVTCGDTYCTMLEVTVTSDCPDVIFSIAGEECGVMNFEIGSFVEGEAVTWFPGDETGAVETGHFFSHTYAAPGEYTVCAFYTSPACPNGVELCTSVVVESCGNECPLAIVGEPEGCGSYFFSILGAQTGNVIWTFGDETGETSSVVADHTYAQNGVYVVTAQYSGPGCPNGTTLYYTVNVDCGTQDECPQNIFVEYIEGYCYEIGFQVGEPNDDAIVDWYFENETVNDFGDFIFMGFDEGDAGINSACAFYTSPSCPNGTELCVEFFVCTPETACPTEIWSGPSQLCGGMHFEIGSFVEGEAVVWFPGDDSGPVDGGHFFEHMYSQPGDYQVCAFYTSPLCPNGVELCTTIVVESCGNECPIAIVGEPVDCDSYFFSILGAETGNVIWTFGDETGETSSVVADHTYAQNGVYVVTAHYSGPGCPDGITLNYTVNVQCEGEPVCPNEISITTGELCHQYTFSVNNWGESPYGDINWNFGDNEGYGMNDFLHLYSEAGTYNVCAWGTTDACPDGFEICTTLVVEACGGNDQGCPDFIWAAPVNDCGIWHFEAGAPTENENAFIFWDFGDGTESDEFNTIADHEYTADGVYTVFVTMQLYGNECAATIVLETTIDVNVCEENPCELEIWSGQGEECGFMQFEAGSFVEGEEFIWYFGDGTSAEGGHYITHQYTEPGTYVVQCVYSNINCPGYQLFTEIVVEDCWSTCTEVVLTLDSYIGEGGPSAAYWSLENGDGALIDQGVAQYTENDPYFDEVICLEDGCYTLNVEGLDVANALDVFLQIAGESIIQNIEVSNDNLIHITFGVNSDCVADCTPSTLLFSSFTAGGGTTGVAYALTNTSTNEIVVSGNAEFNNEIQTVLSEICLEDGCYSFLFDSSLPIAAGQGLQYQLLVDGENVLTTANVTYADNYAMSFAFGINSDCSQSACEASFEPIFTNTPGHIEFQNTSTYDGAAEWHWDYGNGVTSDGQGGNVWYETNGVYVVCLTIYTEGCTDTYCETITVTNMESGCELNEVTITIVSEYATKDAFDMIELLFDVNGITLEGLDITAYEGSVVLAGCVPDGCYEVTAQAPEGMEITADAISITVDAGEASVLLGLNADNNSVSAELGINSDCGDGVNESTLSMFVIYPNPANEMLNVRSSDNQKIERLEIIDASGRMVMSANQSSQMQIASIATGCYFVKVTTANNAAVLPLNIQH